MLQLTHRPTPGVIALCDVRIGGIVLRQVRVVDRGRGVFVNYPSRKVADIWIDLVEITSPALRLAVDDAIMEALRGVA